MHGNKMQTKVFVPSEIYEEVKGDYSDMVILFDDLYQRVAGTIDHQGTIYLEKN